MATEVIFLRVKPEVKEMLEAAVIGMNASRAIGEPEHTLTSLVMRCVAQTFEDVTKGAVPAKSAKKKPSTKGKRK